MTSTHLLIGLGNPGSKYAGNRHNAGFLALDAIQKKYGFRTESSKFGGLVSEGAVDGQRVLCFKPMSYMNLSGEPTLALVQFFKIPLSAITVFHDELDLQLCKVRVKRGGGAGGHNGLKSLDAHLGADYRRVRLGIGHPGDKDMVSDYVLHDFGKEERANFDALAQNMAVHLPLLLANDEAGFMNQLAVASGRLSV